MRRTYPKNIEEDKKKEKQPEINDSKLELAELIPNKYATANE